MNELTLEDKEAILRDNPELCLDDLRGALRAEVIRGIRNGEPDGFLICEIASVKPGHVDVRVLRLPESDPSEVKVH